MTNASSPCNAGTSQDQGFVGKTQNESFSDAGTAAQNAKLASEAYDVYVEVCYKVKGQRFAMECHDSPQTVDIMPT